MISFASWCAGIGGIDLGLERAGMSCRYQIEIDPYCNQILAKHWPHVERYGDLKQLSGYELPGVDVLAGGYPCQPFSQAGARRGEADPRHLWPDFIRLIRVLIKRGIGPRVIMLENVPGHLVLGFGAVLRDLAGCGFDAEWCCFRASDFGAAHIRKRVFIVAHRAGGGRRELREPSGADGERFIHRGGGQLANSAWIEPSFLRWESGRLRRRGIRETGEPMADPGHGLIQEPGRGSGRRVRTRPPGAAVLADPARDDGRTRGIGETARAWESSRAGPSVCSDVSRGRNLDGRGEDVSDPGGAGLPDAEPAQLPGEEQGSRTEPWGTASELCGSFAPGPSDPRWGRILAERPDLAPALAGRHDLARWVHLCRCAGIPIVGVETYGLTGAIGRAVAKALREKKTEPAFCRVVDGIPAQLDRALIDRTRRLSRLGNAVVPQVAEHIGRLIVERFFHQPGF